MDLVAVEEVKGAPSQKRFGAAGSKDREKGRKAQLLVDCGKWSGQRQAGLLQRGQMDGMEGHALDRGWFARPLTELMVRAHRRTDEID